MQLGVRETRGHEAVLAQRALSTCSVSVTMVHESEAFGNGRSMVFVCLDATRKHRRMVEFGGPWLARWRVEARKPTLPTSPTQNRCLVVVICTILMEVLCDVRKVV